MKKDLKYYMELNYPIEIVKINNEEGGGYQASIPLLGKYAFVGDGETIEDAIKDLEEVKEILFSKYIEEGIPIPEPEENNKEKQYSGRFILRLPVELHRFLVLEAKKNKTTLNQYCTYLLTRKAYLQSIQEEIASLNDEIKDVFARIKEIHYKIVEPKKTAADIESLIVRNISEYRESA